MIEKPSEYTQVGVYMPEIMVYDDKREKCKVPALLLVEHAGPQSVFLLAWIEIPPPLSAKNWNIKQCAAFSFGGWFNSIQFKDTLFIPDGKLLSSIKLIQLRWCTLVFENKSV